MRKGLIILDNVDLRKVISANMSVYVDVEMTSVPNADRAMDYLKDNPDTALIVTKNNMGEENTVLKVFYYVNSNKLNIPIICLGQCFKLGAETSVRIFEEMTKSIDPLVKSAAKMMGITAEAMAELETDPYFPVPVRQLTLVSKVPVRIYKMTDWEKDICEPLFEPGTAISKDMVRKLLFDKIDTVYIDPMDRVKFVNSLSEQANDVLKSANSGNTKVVEASMALFDNSQALIAKTGLNEKASRPPKAPSLE